MRSEGGLSSEVAVMLTVFAGGLIALQAPINSTLGKTVDNSFAAASISFLIGTLALVGITALVGGFGGVGEARHLSWYYLTGGLLGAVYVTTALVAVRTLGAGGVTAATITGQLTASVLIDRAGVLGLSERPLSAQRLIGVALLAVGLFLIVRE
jgi:transporter family-2 protein